MKNYVQNKKSKSNNQKWIHNLARETGHAQKLDLEEQDKIKSQNPNDFTYSVYCQHHLLREKQYKVLKVIDLKYSNVTETSFVLGKDIDEYIDSAFKSNPGIISIKVARHPMNRGVIKL